MKKQILTTSYAFLFSLLCLGGFSNLYAQGMSVQCERTIQASVVVMDQVLVYNRLGATQPGGMIYVLEQDVRSVKGEKFPLEAGEVILQPYKRPRPLVLRINQGDCLEVKFTNLLNNNRLGYPTDPSDPTKATQPWTTNTQTRKAGFNPLGVQLVNQTNQTTLDYQTNQKECNFSPSENGILNSSSLVGSNPSSLANPLSPEELSSTVRPGKTMCYKFYAPEQGAFLINSSAANVGGTGAGQTNAGLFGAIHVEPPGAEYYRSQITALDMRLATDKKKSPTTKGQPIINYQAKYPIRPKNNIKTNHPESRAAISANYGNPILNMLKPVAGYDNTYELIYSDLTAIITGPNAGRFPANQQGPEFFEVPTNPDRRQPFREVALFYHSDFFLTQAFPQYTQQTSLIGTNIGAQLGSGGDNFGINYGMAGISSEILANRLGVGPMGECVDCKYEEFFLSSWAVGDPAMIVDRNPLEPPYTSANADCNPVDIQTGEACTITTPELVPQDPSLPIVDPSDPSGTYYAGNFQFKNILPKAKKAYYPDDPSNVYHSYMRDHTTFRIHHGGSDLHHVHHQHAHQWLHSPNSSNGHYLDSQTFGPGSSFTLEMVYNGAGNRNQTVGDSIFHCHFYPHFAEGMWGHWRVHDTFEPGTLLKPNGVPVSGKGKWNRALPDGEIAAGTPTPAIVPIPTLPMAPMPARVRVVAVKSPVDPKKTVGHRVQVNQADLNNNINAGYPFYIPGIAGKRAPHPPMDFAKTPDGKELNGGLPRHIILDGFVTQFQTIWNFGKYAENYQAMELPSDGTKAEQVAMSANATRATASFLPNLDAMGNAQSGNFILNGMPPVAGAPYADPCTLDNGDAAGSLREYKAANVQLDVIFNKSGWHYPQQRIITLWGDVIPTLFGLNDHMEPIGQKAPEPFFFRANTNDCIQYKITNLVPAYYKVDNFQIRTPTDILGQHIHLVKFDVTSSDGAANGFNYEDGTFSPEEVQERISAINKAKGLLKYNANFNTKKDTRKPLTIQKAYYFCDVLEQLKGGPNSAIYEENCENPDPYLLTFNPVSSELCEKTAPEKGYICEVPKSKTVGKWVGAQTTIQRWFADPQLNNLGNDNTLRSVFTHDHFSPSTHQQAGLYATLLVEPENSTWFDPLTNDPLGNRELSFHYRDKDGEHASTTVKDGGPTSWQANIVTQPESESYREFALMMQDLALTQSPFAFYENIPVELSNATTQESMGRFPFAQATIPLADLPATTSTEAKFGWYEYRRALTVNRPQFDAQIISSDVGTGMFSFNYRSEPLALRVNNPGTMEWAPKGVTTTDSAGVEVNLYGVGPGYQPPANFAHTPELNAPNCNASPEPPFRSDSLLDPYCFNTTTEAQQAGDLSFGYTSIDRANTLLNIQPVFPQQVNEYEHINQTEQDKNIATPNPDPTQNFLYPRSLYCPWGADCSKYDGIVKGNDPYTPILRAYEGDKIQVRYTVGAHLTTHFFGIQGVKWLKEPNNMGSGWRNNQVSSISEHFELLFELPKNNFDDQESVDFLYAPSIGNITQDAGNWGILRSYDLKANPTGLAYLPNNNTLNPANQPPNVCPDSAPKITYEVAATTAGNLPIYSDQNGNEVTILDALVYYVESAKYELPGASSPEWSYPSNSQKRTLPNPPEPLVLRASAGDCIEVTLTNNFKVDLSQPSDTWPLPFSTATTNGAVAAPAFGSPTGGYNSQNLESVSPYVGLHPQVVSYDAAVSNGMQVGLNTSETVAAPNGGSVTYQWYAGNLKYNESGDIVGIPVEFGSVNLLSSDPVQQQTTGLIGALIIEPEGATWFADETTKTPSLGASANVKYTQDGESKTFREFVVLMQNNLITNYPTAVASNNNADYAVNYGTEPFYFRMNQAGLLATSFRNYNDFDVSCIYSDRFSPVLPVGSPVVYYNYLQGAPLPQQLTPGPSVLAQQGVAKTAGRPETPLFTAYAGQPVRFRLLNPGGDPFSGQIFSVNGHVWQEEPYQSPNAAYKDNPELYASTRIGYNPESQWQGSRMGYGPASRYDVVIPKAGGEGEVTGDYLYRTMQAIGLRGGLWGIFRVVPKPTDGTGVGSVTITQISNSGGLNVSGYVTENPVTEAMPTQVEIFSTTDNSGGACTGASIMTVDVSNGLWANNPRLPMTWDQVKNGVCVQTVEVPQKVGVSIDTFDPQNYYVQNPACVINTGPGTISTKTLSLPAEPIK